MLILLLGPDDFSKREHISSLAKKDKAEAEFFVDAENLPNLENLVQQDIFSKPRIFVLKGLIKYFNSPSVIEKLIVSQNQIILVEEKLDKRLTDNKQLLANKNITVKQFNLPHGEELNHWLEQRIKFYNGQASTAAINTLAIVLGSESAKETKFGGKVVEVEEVYNLWQADSEVKKLVAFSGGNEITPQDVKALANENGEVDMFELTNAIADNEKQKALELLNKFLPALSGTDEKGAIIQLNALLSEQFRNVAAVQDFIASKKTESEILETTGWKSGRLFIMKKIATKFNSKKILELLNKLGALDEELKTTSTPPRVLLDLILVQLFV